ncbi:MAG: hypothetical protein BWY91_01111 [bacterium ADurb.BinA028]|nr:MAG: hypothetical protein BWY91_01111 [bacterium ADurb.BinA028]
MGQVDAVHRRAVADVLLEEGDRLLGEHGRQALDQVEFGADHPGGPGRSSRHGLDDLLGRADDVGRLADLVLALGVDDYSDPGDLASSRLDRVDREPAVDRAVPPPQDDSGGLHGLLGEPAAGAVRVVDDAVVQRQTQLPDRRVATQVLVGQEQHLAGALDSAGLLKGPLQRSAGVGRRADRAAVPTRERLDRGRGVHIRHGDGVLRDPGVDEVVPAVVDLGRGGHVGHRAAGRQIGEHDRLGIGGEDVGRFGHEVHAAEDDPLCLRAGGGLLRQLERVAGHVRELDDLVALIVVPEHEHLVPERRLGRAGASDQIGVGRGGQVAGAFDAAFAVQVAALPQDEQAEGSVLRGHRFDAHKGKGMPSAAVRGPLHGWRWDPSTCKGGVRA